MSEGSSRILLVAACALVDADRRVRDVVRDADPLVLGRRGWRASTVPEVQPA